MSKSNTKDKINILVIEDNEDDLFFIRKTLPSNRYCLTEIDSGNEALNYLLKPKTKPDVVLLDKQLPGINGLEILEKLKERDINYGIIFLTIDNNINTVIQAMKSGALDFIVKSKELKKELPEKIEKVHNIHNSLLEKRRMEQEAAIAKRSADFKQNFLANMSHEIRTPITGILGMAEILNKTELTPQQKDFVNTIIQSGESLKEIINRILDFSKIEAGKITLKKEVFSINEIIEEAKKLFSSLNPGDIILETEKISPAVPEYIKSDKHRLNQIINNLLSNAVKFTKEGKISISTTVVNDNNKAGFANGDEVILKFEISDTGVGISEKEKKLLFKPFSQIEHTLSEKSGSSGLGLSICRELCNLFGGEINVKSPKGKGSTFWFTIKAIVMTEPVKSSSRQKHHDIKIYKPLNVLLVEDQHVIQKVISLLLKSMGHKVTVANNGEEALKVFEPGKFDIILMDIQMPVMDGVAATKKLKEKYPNLPPVIGLSAYALEGDRKKFMTLGMDEYLTKPFEEDEFNKVIKIFEKNI